MTLIPNEYQQGINEAFKISTREISALKDKIRELEEQLRAPSVLNSVATEYAEFCVKCDREGLPILCLEDYVIQCCK